MTNSGITENGITYPIAGIDEFTPAQGMQDMAESIEAFIGPIIHQLRNSMWPVGCIYESTNPTNPAYVFGFGTWESYGPGRVTVGVQAANNDYATAGLTGGVESVLLTAAQSGLRGHHHHVPAIATAAAGEHSHIINSGHAHNAPTNQVGAIGANGSLALSFHIPTHNAGNHQHTVPANNTHAVAEAHAQAAHENRPPYVTVHRWVRTA